MIKVNAEGLRDFRVCERYYDYKFNDGLEEKRNIRERRVDRFGETIKSIATFFFYKKQGFSEPSYQALEHRWQKAWFKEDTTALDIATTRNEILWESDISYTTQAAVALMAFHEDFYNKLDLEVVMISEPFSVPINKQIAVEGCFDVVLRQKKENGDYHYYIYKWVTSNLKKSISYWAFDFAILDYAFKYRNQNKLDVSYYIWNFGSTNPRAIEIELEPEDVESMIFWAQELTNKKIFIPRRGYTAYCKSCSYDAPCASFSFKDVNNG